MRKVIGIVLLAVFALSFVAGIVATPVQANGSEGCREVCHRVYLYWCCGPNTELGPGCIQIGRCE